jgi:tetratricopeptide (TPR) repeat protein
MKAQAAWAEAKAIAAYRLNLRQARSFGREQQHFSLEPGSGLTVFGLDSFQARLQQHVQQQQLEPPATTPPVSNPVLVRMGEEYMAERNTCIELARYLRHTSGSSHQSRLRATFLRATAKLDPGSSSSPPVAAKTTLSATEQAQVWYGAGLEANAEGDSGRALDFFTQALSVEPERPSFLLSAGNMHLKLGAPAEALRLYTQCEKWLKTLPPAHALMLEEKMKTATLLLSGRRSTRPRESSPMRRQQQSSSLVGSEALERATEERLRI